MIGIISDTHDNVQMIRKAVSILKQRNPKLVIHLGDVTAPKTMVEFKGLTMKFILGNCDSSLLERAKRAKQIGAEQLDAFAELEIDGKKIAALHGKPLFTVEALVKSQIYDYVLYGHTHEKKDEKVGKTRVLNPGGFYHGDEPYLVFIDLKKDEVEFVKVV